MRVLWIPLLSMRSYEDGKYSLLKDGNFQLTLARINSTDFDQIDLVLPKDEQLSDFNEFYKNKIVNNNKKICFLHQLEYGVNAVNTREIFWEKNEEFFKNSLFVYDLVITDITGFPYADVVPVINNFNITKLAELDRPYIDDFFSTDLNSIQDSIFTTVINPRQAEYIIEHRPSLKDKVIAHTKVAAVCNLPSTTEMPEEFITNEIFWPFRISDKAYKFEEVMVFLKETKLYESYRITITDPNDTFTKELEEKYPFVVKRKLSKSQYYARLAARPVIIMLDDPDLVLHPGTIEFFFYMCRVITLKSKLLNHKNEIEKIEDLTDILKPNLDSSRPEDFAKRFIYLDNEIDPYYNKKYVQNKINNFRRS